MDQRFASPRTGGPSKEPSPAPQHSTHFRTPSSPRAEDMAYNKRLSISSRSSRSSSSTRVENCFTSPSSAKQRMPAPEPFTHPGHGDRRPPLPENLYHSPQSTRTSPLLSSPMQIHHEPTSTRSRPIQTPITHNFSPRTPPPTFSSPPLKRSRAEYEADNQRSAPTSEPPQSRARTDGIPPLRQHIAQPYNQRNSPRTLSPAQSGSAATFLVRHEDADAKPVVVKMEPRDDMDQEEGEVNDASSQLGRSRPSSSRSEPSAPPFASRLPTPPQSIPIINHRPPPSNPFNIPPPATQTESPITSRSQVPSISRPRISLVPRPTAGRTNTMEKPAEQPPTTPGGGKPTNSNFYHPQLQESRVDNNLQTRPQVTQPLTPQVPPQPPRPKQLGISHIDLLYKTENGSMVCRMCM
ncbi:hypothetical protein CPB83DRAFT_144250 [Crepidotus variabilis]|uniref:Uncharacterized protein n=1 Tax=Crepidotus variabilis TaxID=179855 RepID=A0A9P6EKP0_9AGAR|nr:hypothetical protein CPB83DRAFT_144250 [Crepidotus variabilis]